MKLFDTVKKKVGWAAGAVVTVAVLAQPFVPPQYQFAIQEINNFFEKKETVENEKTTTDN